MRGESVDVVVIGSGIGGLTAARMLAEFGHKRVLVLEQHYTLGGTTHEFTRDARFHFATGVHYLGTAVEGGSPQAMLDYLSDRQLQWQRLPHEFDVILWSSTSVTRRSGRCSVRNGVCMVRHRPRAHLASMPSSPCFITRTEQRIP